MSVLYDKSRDMLKEYFARPEDFEKLFAKYYLGTGELVSSGRYGCSGRGGVPVSGWDEKGERGAFVSVDDSDVHTLVIGATASKKSRLLAMPTVRILGQARESMVIVDPKAEIFDRTAGDLEELGYSVATVDLRNPHIGSAWNPFAFPYMLYKKSRQNDSREGGINNDYDRACEFVNDIANNLSKMQIGDRDPFWENSAASFLFGLILLLFKYVFENDLNEECVNIRNMLKLRRILCDNFYAGQPVTVAVRYAQSDDFIYSLLIGTLETAKNTQAGILSTFDQWMRMFAIQPSLLDMLTSDDRVIRKVREEPTALFLIVPDEKTSYHNLVSLFVKQSYEYFIHGSQSVEGKDEKRIRINYILDEFSSLPTITDFPAMITAARSRDIRFMLFIQSEHQLDLRYKEEAETIKANCNNWIFLVSREVKLLEDLSILCGNRKMADGSTVPVLSVAGLQRLEKDKGEALVISGRNKPFIARLPDIQSYDGGKFKRKDRDIKQRKRYDVEFNFRGDVRTAYSTDIGFDFLYLEWPPGGVERNAQYDGVAGTNI
jgi:type IV secretion system protein VirD4